MSQQTAALTNEEIVKASYLSGMHDAIVVVFTIIGEDNANLITTEMFNYYYEKLKEEKLI